MKLNEIRKIELAQRIIDLSDPYAVRDAEYNADMIADDIESRPLDVIELLVGMLEDLQ